MDVSIKNFLKKGQSLKVIYRLSDKKSDSTDITKAFYGAFEDCTDKFLIMTFPNSKDRNFIDIDSIITLSEEQSRWRSM